MSSYFVGSSADEVWRQASAALAGPDAQAQAGRGGSTRELLHVMSTITDPRRRWVGSRLPGINPAFSIAEAFWILAGRDDAALVNFWNPALPRFAGEVDRYHGAYGRRLRHTFDLDQIERAVDALSVNAESRQVVLQIWDPRSDFPASSGEPVAADIPCNVSCFPKVRGGRLEWMQVMRSNDLYRGTPYNFVQFTILQEFVAGCLGVGLGHYVHVADSLHCYTSDIDRFAVATSPAAATGKLRIDLPRSDANEALAEVVGYLDALIKPGLDKVAFRGLLSSNALPEGHRDMLAIVAADSARRRGWTDLQEAAAAGCGDTDLLHVWRQWEMSRKVNSAPKPEGATGHV